MSPTSEATAQAPSVATVADGCLLLSHRLTEWVGNAPTMEEDVAVGNIALDLLGQARGLLGMLGDEDQLAYFRDADTFDNPALCAAPNGDFARTMLRQLFADSWLGQVWAGWTTHDDDVVRGVAEKAVKENAYHRRHSRAWVVRLGDGTEESHLRMLTALDELWPLTTEIAMPGWRESVADALVEATLPVPSPAALDAEALASCAEARRELLAEMQSLARTHPGATW
ncbi:MAG TPA: 1,2-phenylacetyl-CoA epoxidase subunit PaaC [Mycobacteriales bacterium]|nr:1,2-phenylacetyl-CoA epoxidase subunit PaaC [Mycobacteriales bacterium]